MTGRCIRGGTGVYFADALTVDAFWPKYNTQLARIQVNNDGRPDFAANPLNGQPLPTYEQAQNLFCHSPAQAANFAAWQASNYAGAAPCLLLATQEMPAPDQYMQMARAWTSSIGFQHQFGSAMAQLQADYIYRKGDHEKDTLDNINLAYNPATGVNYPYAASAPTARCCRIRSTASMSMIPHNTRSRVRGAADRVHQAHEPALAGLGHLHAVVVLGRGEPAVQRPRTSCRSRWRRISATNFTYGQDDQRHRSVFNGIWEVAHGFQVSAMHYFGAGIRASTNYGGDLRSVGAAAQARLRPNGTIVPRNGFIQPEQNKTDIRVQQRIPLGGRKSIDLIAEVFNAFNKENYSLVTTGERGELQPAGQRTEPHGAARVPGYLLTP